MIRSDAMGADAMATRGSGAVRRSTQLLAAAGASLLFASGCASHAQTAPVYREAAAPGSTEAAVREEFDPARFRQDLLLIQPVFTPPAVITEPVPQPSPAVLTPGPTADAGAADTAPMTADTVDVAVFRVQVIALSSEDGARRIADELRRRFEVATEVTAQGRLFAVRAGELRQAAAAESLRTSIAALSRGYEGAFLVRDTVRVDTAAIDSAWVETARLDAPVGDLGAGLPDDPAVLDTTATVDPDEAAALPQPEPELVLVPGWRVLIGQFTNLADAQQYRAQVMKRLRRDDVDVKFEAPWYKVLAGSFRGSNEAQQFVERCRSLGFRTAALVRGDVYLPKEQEANR